MPNPPSVVTIAWSMVSGTGTVTFTDANAVDTSAGFSEAGIYLLRLTANDGELIDSDDITITVNPEPDLDPPNPNPMKWQILPQATGRYSISMTATTASDPSGVEYYFECVAGGGHDSLWQDSPTFEDTGLLPDTEYIYRIKAQYKSPNQNETNWSLQASAITEENLLPVADSQSINTEEDTNKVITLTASDMDLDTLTYIIVNQPSHGTLEGIAPNLTYSPNTNYNGTDSFTFKANDGHGDSNIATVSITISPVNDTPVAIAQAFTTQENTAINKTLSASDIDGDGLIYSIAANGTKGIATITNASTGTFAYTPNKDMNGMDTFRFKVNDGKIDSSTATVTVNIIPVNDVPVADSGSLSTAENTALTITLTASDQDGDTLTYTIVAQPLHGTLSGTAPNLTYTPNNNYSGSDSFAFNVNDDFAESNIATISITINLINDPNA